MKIERNITIVAGAALIVGALIVGSVQLEASNRIGGGTHALPVISAMAGSEGSLVGGETVILMGKFLSDVSSVTFHGEPALHVDVIDDRTIVATVPAIADFEPTTVAVAAWVGSVPVSSSAAIEYTYTSSSSVDRQMQYLMTHWNNYNTAAYGDLNPIGGDCNNFVSQSLIARGWKMTGSWYNYRAGEEWADAWGHVPSFDEWLRAQPGKATMLPFTERDEVKIGDLVVFDWNNNDSLDHIQVVSKIEIVDGVTKIAMIGHNLDTDYRDLDATITIDHPGATGYFWSIP